jgi:CheY-like chemotaxis protein
MSDAGPKRVLIVDDDPADGELTVRRLDALDAEVEFHLGPEGAIERLRGGEYDVVLLDLNMPGITGLQILHILREEKANVRVLLYSAMDEAGLAEVAATAGVAHLNKSAARTVLQTTVRDLLAG